MGSLADSLYKLFPIPGDLYRIVSFVLFLLGMSVGPFIGLTAAAPIGEVKLNGVSLGVYPFLLPSVIIGCFFLICISFSAFCLQSNKRSRRVDSNVSYRPVDSDDETELLHPRESIGMDATVHGSGFEMAENNSPGLAISVDGNSSSSVDNSSSLTLTNTDSTSSLDDSTISITSPLSQFRRGGKKQRNRVLFSTMVTVKVIGSPDVEYDHLKHLCHDEKPIDCVAESSSVAHSNDHASSSYPVYGNGSELFLDELSDLNASRGIAKLLSKETILVCLVMNGLSGMLAVFTAELIYLDLLNSAVFEDKMSIFALFEFSNGMSALLTVTVLSLFFMKKVGTLFVFYRSSQIFSLVVLLTFFMPFIFEFTSEVAYYGIIWVFSAMMCSCAATMVLLIFSFTNNSSYNHEKVVVNRAATIALLLGLLSGSYMSVSLFNVSEWLRDEFELRFQVAWIMLIVLARLLIMLLRRLPNKIQRSMREPAKPRYALSMQQTHDADAGFTGSEDDHALENMESSVSSRAGNINAMRSGGTNDIKSNGSGSKSGSKNSKSIQL